MNVKTVKLNRKYNLGNYEQAEIGLEVDLTEIEGADAETVKKAMIAIDKLFPHPVIPELFMDLPKLGEPTVKAEDEENTDAEMSAIKSTNQKTLTLGNIDWVEGGETDKGPYQKSASKPIDFYNVKKAIEEKGRPITVDGFSVWYMDKLDVLARRRK